jgi:hypothetical protein
MEVMVNLVLPSTALAAAYFTLKVLLTRAGRQLHEISRV